MLQTILARYTICNSLGNCLSLGMIGKLDVSFMANYHPNWSWDVSHLLLNCVKCLSLINQLAPRHQAALLLIAQ